jgi:hypothetical protein
LVGQRYGTFAGPARSACAKADARTSFDGLTAKDLGK